MSSAAGAVSERSIITTEIGTALRHTLVYGIGGILLKVISFIMLPVYTHFLTPRDYGVLEILDLSMTLVAMFLNMGMTAAFLRFYNNADSSDVKRTIASTMYFFALGTGLLILLGGWWVVPAASRMLLGPGIPPTLLYLSFSYFVLGYISTIPYTQIRAKEESVKLMTFDSGAALLHLVLNIYFIAVLKISVTGVLLSALLIGVLKAAILLYWVWGDLKFRIDWSRLRDILAFGAPLIFCNVTLFVLNFSDRFFLQRFQSLDVVGIYAVGYKFGYMLSFLFIQPFNMMWQGRMYLVQRRPDHERVFSQVFVLYSVLMIFAALSLGLFSSEIVRVMVDRRYAAGATIIGVTSLAYVFLGAAYYLQLGMYLASRTGLIGAVSSIAAVVNIVLNYLLIPRFGMYGAAWATVAGFLVIAAASYYCSQRVLPLRLGVGRVVKALVVAVGMYVLANEVKAASLVIAVLVKLALLVAFGVLIWLGGIFSADERHTVGALIGQARQLTSRWKIGWLRA
jgi:O-antigen/teichoic acid export membrane protein